MTTTDPIQPTDRTTDHLHACARAARAQGIADITTALAARAIPVEIEHGHHPRMIATVTLRNGTLLVLTRDGDGVQIIETTRSRWASSDALRDRDTHHLATLADAVTWTQDRAANTDALWWTGQVLDAATDLDLPTAQTHPGQPGRLEARWTWPSGNPHLTVTVDAGPGHPVEFRISAYHDDEYTEPHYEQHADTPAGAVDALRAAIHRENADPSTTPPSRPGPTPKQTVTVTFDLFADTHHFAADHLADLLTDTLHGTDATTWHLHPAHTQPDPEGTCSCDPLPGNRHLRGCDAYDGWRD